MRPNCPQRSLSASAILLALVCTMSPLAARHHTPTPTASATNDADMASGSSISGTTPTPTPSTNPSAPAKKTPPMAKSLPTYQVEPGSYFLPDDVKAAKVKVITYDELKKSKDGSYHVKFSKPVAGTPPDQVYYEVRRTWCESITGVDLDPSKGIEDNQTQIRSPIGDVEVALPTDPTKFSPATDLMVIPAGSIVKTGDGSSAGILFGRTASTRLIPNSMAVAGLQLTDKEVVISVEMKSGGAFVKIAWWSDLGVSYSMKTTQGSVLGVTGIAGGKPVNKNGLEFALYTAPDRSDLYVLKGPVDINDPSGTKTGSFGPKEHLVIVGRHIPPITDPSASLASTGESLGALLSSIPMMNVNSKMLQDKVASGKHLTAKEDDYMSRIYKVGVYERLDRVLTLETPTVTTPTTDMTPTPTPVPTLPPLMPPVTSPTPDATSPTMMPSPTPDSSAPSPTPSSIPMVSPTPAPSTTDVPTPPAMGTPSLPPSLPMTPPNPMLPSGTDSGSSSPGVPTPSPAPSNP